jgi:sugar phosphate isomerase/epimerase
VVLFCDGDPLAEPGLLERLDPRAKRDGFAETRRELLALAGKFPGKVLVVFSQTAEPDNEPAAIRWQANIGKIGIRAGWMKLHVDNTGPALFSVAPPISAMNAAPQ